MEILVQNNGGVYSNGYVRIASDIEQRLFGAHNVDKKKGQWAWARCENADSARDDENYFVDTLGTHGGPGGGEDTSKYVYAYRITSDTKQ